MAATLLQRAERRLETTARAALNGGDVDGAYVAAYDAYRMTAEALLACQGLRATGGDGSHMTVEDAVSAQFALDIPAFAKPTFERFRRTRHSAQYFDPDAAPITKPMRRGRLRRRPVLSAGRGARWRVRLLAGLKSLPRQAPVA